MKPIHKPIIPATPAKTGGAGTGNLNAAKTMPHPKPVSVDNRMSFIILFITIIQIVRMIFWSWGSGKTSTTMALNV